MEQLLEMEKLSNNVNAIPISPKPSRTHLWVLNINANFLFDLMHIDSDIDYR